MKNRNFLILISVILVACSVLLYFLHFLIFRDEHHIFIFLLHDIAFLPLEVLIVGLVIERLLAKRETASISFDDFDLEQLRSFLISKRPFMLRLIENPQPARTRKVHRPSALLLPSHGGT